jgi:predicted alpha/beta-hydrolase family hydrolase
MEWYRARPDGPLLVLAHGAGAGEQHPWIQRVARRLATQGISVVTFDFPYMQARRGRPDPAPVLEAAYRTTWDAVTRDTPPATRCFAGGKSMGGRIASQVAAANGFTPPAVGLVFFGYPLHPPDAPAKRRDAHLARIARPMLFLHGTRDPFGSPDEMRDVAAALPSARLHLVDGGDHSLQRSRRWDLVDEAIDTAAAWIRDHAEGRS